MKFNKKNRVEILSQCPSHLELGFKRFGPPNFAYGFILKEFASGKIQCNYIIA